jgi:hypothetical protein
MRFNKNQLAAHTATVAECERKIERFETILFLAGGAVTFASGVCGLFCLIG